MKTPDTPDTVERRADRNIFKPHAKALLRAAAASIRYALQNGEQPVTDLLTAPEPEWWTPGHGTWEEALAISRKPYPAGTEWPKTNSQR